MASLEQINSFELVVESGDSAQIIGKKLENLSLKTGLLAFLCLVDCLDCIKILKQGCIELEKVNL